MYHILVEETPTEVIHPNASDLPGLLLLVVHAGHSVVDHQTTRAESRQVGYPRKGFSMENKVLQSLSVGKIRLKRAKFAKSAVSTILELAGRLSVCGP